MSFKEQGNQVKYADYTSLDKLAVVAILNWLDYAEKALINRMYSNALDDIDMAWAKLPNVVREDIKKPSQVAEEKIKTEIPSLRRLVSSHMYDNMSSHAQKKERAGMVQEAIESVVKDSILQIITALDKYGLYISREKTIQATSEKTMKDQPSLAKLPPTMKRETS